jgi:uracil-DNA glycosylase family protein
MSPVPSLTRLRAEAAGCTRCDLYRQATQTVFGEGPATARLVMIGEQPGDKEDLDGHPFVGPAGRLLDRALADAGIDRRTVYVTNAVKHFKWKRGNGKVRLHQKPNREEVRACACWWEAELEAVKPELVVLLGATAAQAVLGPKVRVTRDRGMVLPAGEVLAYDALVTIHPSAILRTRPPERDAAFDELVRDLRVAADHIDR